MSIGPLGLIMFIYCMKMLVRNLYNAKLCEQLIHS